MRLATSTCADSITFHERSIVVSAEEAISSCVKAGFKILDFSFHNYARDGGPLASDNWETWLLSIKKLGQELGVEWNQGHAFIYPKDGMLDAHNDIYEEKIRRCIIGAGILGVKNLVLHPRNFFVDDEPAKGYDRKRSKEENLKYIQKYLKIASPYPNIHFALENLFLPSGIKNNRYCSSAEELVELADCFDERVGVCWDFGHANISGQDQCKSLKTIGRRLYATHVHDNAGFIDEHILPFFGRIKWTPIMQTLKEIDYQGDFTYETQHFTGGLPLDKRLRAEALKLAYDIGIYLVSM